jgi:hypothetical protein
LDFGTSLNNTPTVVNLGNVGVFFDYPFEIDQFIKTAIHLLAFLNLSDNLQRLEFGTNITNPHLPLLILGNMWKS